MNKLALPITAMLLTLGCSKPRPGEPARETPSGTARQPTVDPKSNAAAEELARSFAHLLETGKAGEAYMLLGPSAPPREKFDADFERIRNLRVSVGDAGDQEGAAGSIYASVPLTITGTLEGRQVNRSAKAVLRRVNDVPGSTQAQRHWHIERIDWDR
jgi:hypothetical protein